MANETADMLFADAWLWLVFIGIGLVLIMLELFMGIDTGLDLVFIGSAVILGGLVTIALHSWVWTAIVSGGICLLYLVIGRRYIHRRIAADITKTNIDTIIGKAGIAEQPITPGSDGLVKVGNEQWRARSEDAIGTGEQVTVVSVTGVTLTVIKRK